MTDAVSARGRWMALVAAFLGWMFDGMEIGLFPIAGRPALRELHRQELRDRDRRVVGWADHLLPGGVEPAGREAGLQPLRPLADLNRSPGTSAPLAR